MIEWHFFDHGHYRLLMSKYVRNETNVQRSWNVKYSMSESDVIRTGVSTIGLCE